MSHHLSKTKQTEWTSLLSRHSYQGGGPCDGESRTWVGSTDVSPPVKNNTDRMNQLFGLMFLLGWRSVWGGIPDTCRDHRCLTACQKQHRQNEPAGWVEIATGMEVDVTVVRDTCSDHRRLTACQIQHRQNELAGRVDIPTRVEVCVTGDLGHM